MIKRLLLLMALLAPAVAYGANLTNDLSVQIPAAGSGGGGSGSGGGGGGSSGSGGGSGGGSGSTTAPGAALAGCQTANGGGPSNGSCFNTQIANMDFSGATPSFVGTSGNFNASNVNNWLSGSGCSGGILWASNGYGGTGSSLAPPCSNYTIVPDPLDGQNSLRIAFTQNEVNNGINDAVISSWVGGNSTSAGPIALPEAFYFTYQWHTDAASVSNAESAVSQSPSLYPFMSAFNTLNDYFPTIYNGTDVGRQEWDETENHVPSQARDISGFGGSYGGSFYNYGVPCNEVYGPNYETTNYNPAGCGSTIVSVLSYNPTSSWATVQGRLTSDASGNWAACLWVNGTQIAPCQSGTFPAGYLLGARSGISLWGPSDYENAKQNGVTLPGPIYAYYRNFQIWSCPAWNTGYTVSGGTITITGSQPNPCSGTVLTTNP